MDAVFIKVLNMALTASFVILAVMLMRLFTKRISRRLTCVLWALVAIRLIMPFSLQTAFSLIPSPSPVTVAQTVEATVTEPADPITQTPESTRPHANRPAVPTEAEVDAAAQSDPVPPIAVITPKDTDGVPAQNEPKKIAFRLDVTHIAALVWLIGAAAMLVYGAVSTALLYFRMQFAVMKEGNVYQSEHISSPFVLGLIKPRIFIPYGMDADTQKYVLAHERTHLHRFDHITKPFGFILLCVYWFDPLVWLSYILLCRDIESACDEAVIRSMNGDDRSNYAEALLMCGSHRSRLSACPLAFGESNTKQRIKSVLNYKKPAFWIVIVSVIVVIAAVVCFLTDPLSIRADTPDDTSNETSSETPSQTDETASDDSEPSQQGGEKPTVIEQIETDGFLIGWMSDETCWVLNVNGTTGEKLVFPDEYNGKPITGIDEEAVYDLQDIKEIYIPKSVTHILPGAFCGCSGVEKITVDSENPKYKSAGNCLISVADKTVIAMFKNSVIPTDGSVDKIEYGAICYEYNIDSVTIPKEIIKIGNAADVFPSIDNIEYSGTIEQWKAIDIEYEPYDEYSECSLVDQIGVWTTVHCIDGDLKLRDIIPNVRGNKLQNVVFDEHEIPVDLSYLICNQAMTGDDVYAVTTEPFTVRETGEEKYTLYRYNLKSRKMYSVCTFDMPNDWLLWYDNFWLEDYGDGLLCIYYFGSDDPDCVGLKLYIDLENKCAMSENEYDDWYVRHSKLVSVERDTLKIRDDGRLEIWQYGYIHPDYGRFYDVTCDVDFERRKAVFVFDKNDRDSAYLYDYDGQSFTHLITIDDADDGIGDIALLDGRYVVYYLFNTEDVFFVYDIKTGNTDKVPAPDIYWPIVNDLSGNEPAGIATYKDGVIYWTTEHSYSDNTLYAYDCAAKEMKTVANYVRSDICYGPVNESGNICYKVYDTTGGYPADNFDGFSLWPGDLYMLQNGEPKKIDEDVGAFFVCGSRKYILYCKQTGAADEWKEYKLQ